MFLWDIIALTCLLAKIPQETRSHWTRDWVARRPTINVRNLNFTTKCHSFPENRAKKTI